MDLGIEYQQKQEGGSCLTKEEREGIKSLFLVKQKFQKKHRLTKKSFFFKRKAKIGRHFLGRCIYIRNKISLNSIDSFFNCPKLGVSASKKNGSSVLRNYFKRVIRELFRKTKHLFPEGMKMYIMPTQHIKNISYKIIEEDFHQFIKKESFIVTDEIFSN